MRPPRPAARNARRGRKRESSFISVPVFVFEETVYSGGSWGLGIGDWGLGARVLGFGKRSNRILGDLVALLSQFCVEDCAAHLGHDGRNLDRLARIFCDPHRY